VTLTRILLSIAFLGTLLCGIARPCGIAKLAHTTAAEFRYGHASFRDDYLNLAGPAAQRVMAKYRIPASVGAAQAILESSWGRSTAAVQDRNQFGIKCSHGKPGPIATSCRSHKTTECEPTCQTVTRAFRVYATVVASFRDYGRVLSSKPVYAPAFGHLNDPDVFARQVAAHYATDPRYAHKIIHLMRAYNLYRFDRAASTSRPHAARRAA
jgi:flagellar protein FlgJ